MYTPPSTICILPPQLYVYFSLNYMYTSPSTICVLPPSTICILPPQLYVYFPLNYMYTSPSTICILPPQLYVYFPLNYMYTSPSTICVLPPQLYVYIFPQLSFLFCLAVNTSVAPLPAFMPHSVVVPSRKMKYSLKMEKGCVVMQRLKDEEDDEQVTIN